MKTRMDATHKSSTPALDSDKQKVMTPPFLSRLIALARALFTHPELIGWSCLVLALLFLFIRLGLSDDITLSIWINSDTLYPVNVFTDVLQDGYSLSGWKFSIAPCWFPDLMGVGFFWFVTRNIIMSTLLGGFVQIGLIVGAFHIIGKAVGTRNIHTQDAFLLASGALITIYVALTPGARLYMFFLPQTHVGSMVCVLYGWGMALWFLHQELAGAKVSAWLMTAYGILCLLAGMSNLLFFAHMLVPVTATVAFLIFFGIMTIRQCWKPLTSGWVAAAIGALLNRILFRVTDVSAQSEVSQDRVLTSLDVFMRGFVAQVHSGEIIHLSAIVWSGVCVAYIAWLLRRVVIGGRSSLSRSQISLLTFFLISVISAICSVAAIVLGGSNGLSVFKDYGWSTHYLHQVFFLPLFGFPAVLAWALSYLRSDRVGRIVSWAIITGVLALVLARLAPSQWPTTPIYAYRPPLVRFMDEVAPAKKLRYGYAGYWQARLITLLSRSGVRSYAVNGDMTPFLWVSNEEWYRQLQKDGGAPPKVDFVILDDPAFKLTREVAVQKFGAPLSELQTPLSELQTPLSELQTQGTRILIYAKPR
jgi:hypothetical protein